MLTPQELNVCELQLESHNDQLCSQSMSDAENYPIMQINGRRVYGPPQDWQGPPPPDGCELFIKKLPKKMMENNILPLFARFGVIYEFRLMMDYNNMNRGYGYIRFSNKDSALRALEVMNHYITANKTNLVVQQSYDKCRLFVGNLPRHLTRDEIEFTFKNVFPEMDSLVMHNRISDDTKNRGFGFLDFPDHKAALCAKKKCSPGIIRIWNTDIKIVWANPERTVDEETLQQLRTLFLRNIEMSVSTQMLMEMISEIVDRNLISKISRSRELAFVEFYDRHTAEMAKDKLHGRILNGFSVEAQWAIPPTAKSLSTMKKYDFDAIFRMKCIANFWSPPVLIYGRIFEKSYQCAIIIIHKGYSIHYFLFEVNLHNLIDIQGRIYETMIEIVEESGGLPEKHLIIKIERDDAFIVGHVPNIFSPFPVTAAKLNKIFYMHWEELSELAVAASCLTSISLDTLKEIYYCTLSKTGLFNYIENFEINSRIIGCLDKSHRQRPPLKYNLDDTHIILVLCDATTKTNYHFPYKIEQVYPFLNVHTKELLGTNIACQTLSLLPLNFIQSNYDPHTLKGVHFGYITPIPYNLPPIQTPPINPTSNIPSPPPPRCHTPVLLSQPLQFQFFHHGQPNEFIPHYGPNQAFSLF